MQKVALQNGVKRSITSSRVFVPKVRHVFFFFLKQLGLRPGRARRFYTFQLIYLLKCRLHIIITIIALQSCLRCLAQVLNGFYHFDGFNKDGFFSLPFK